jgi:hypothetical protein
MITALAGGGVVVTDGDLLTTLDENGEVVGTPTQLPASATSGSPATYGGGALWTLIDDARMSLLKGEGFTRYSSAYPNPDGASQPGNPTFQAFIPVYVLREAPDMLTSYAYEGEYRRWSTLNDSITTTFYHVEGATKRRFRDGNYARALDALAFIGDAVSNGIPESNHLAAGLKLHDGALMNFGNPQPASDVPAGDEVTDHVWTTARIVFLGACFMADAPPPLGNVADVVWRWWFPWWNAGDWTRGRAVIYGYRDDPHVQLDRAGLAWNVIATQLLLGGTVKQAVESANWTLRERGYADRYYIYGDETIGVR